MRLVAQAGCRGGALDILAGRAENKGEGSGFCLGDRKGSNSYGQTGCAGVMDM